MFLWELATNPDQYPSLFDHPYLKFWREMHLKHGAKFHFNIYFQGHGFNLTHMPDIWKQEWQENAEWLRLSFHALGHEPAKPYEHADYDTIAMDHDRVVNEITRFAGKEVLSLTTTIHWAVCPVDAMWALRDRGIKILIGLFNVDGSGSYHLGHTQKEWFGRHVIFHDPTTRMIFIKCLIVLNDHKKKEIVPTIEAKLSLLEDKQVLEFLIHEQYFSTRTVVFQASARKKVDITLEWANKQGYKPVFWEDVLL